MVSPGNHGKPDLADTVKQQILVQFQGEWEHRLDVEQMFSLINGALPLEVCLYYQVLPLFLDGNRLYLGMVTPNDTSALEYVRRIVSYLNYSLVPRAITYDALQVALTGYLNYTGNPSTKPRELFSYGHHRHSTRSYVERVEQFDRPTLIVDSPEELAGLTPADGVEPAVPPPQMPASPTPLPPPGEPATPVAPEPFSQTAAYPQAEQVPPNGFDGSQAIPALIESVPPLDIQANHLSSSVEVLASLPAEEMLQELLARVLLGGIGRLYFECHPHYGRVLWSQDGVLQSVMEQLPLDVFHQLLNALKQTADLPPSPITQPKQAEIERLYDRNRVLLRFRFMPGKYGEEATLQVLRGAALRFYQKQQLTRLKRDALGIAKQLQTKLNEIRDRSYAEPGLAGAKFESLPALTKILRNIEEIEAQLDDLGENQPE